MCRSHLQRRRVCASRALLARSFRGDIYTMSNVLKDSRSRTSTRQKENLTVADNIRYDEVTAKLGYIIERYECPAAKQGKTTDELCAGAFRGRVQSDEFIELANLTLGGDGAQEVAELEYKVANEKGSAKLLGEQSI